MSSIELSQTRSVIPNAEANIGTEDELSSATKLAPMKAPAPITACKTAKIAVQSSLDNVRTCYSSNEHDKLILPSTIANENGWHSK